VTLEIARLAGRIEGQQEAEGVQFAFEDLLSKPVGNDLDAWNGLRDSLFLESFLQRYGPQDGKGVFALPRVTRSTDFICFRLKALRPASHCLLHFPVAEGGRSYEIDHTP
jgi:hypothetical protein